MSLLNLQKRLGLKPDGIIGPQTLKTAMNYFKMNNLRAAHFFGQTSHETGRFKLFSENLNYSSNGLLNTFPKYFKTLQDTQSYEHIPSKIANKVYANRMGNGDENSGDGYKFRGRGALQLTGKSNYEEFSKFLKNTEILNNPDLVATEYAFESAIFFFDKNELWTICDKGIDDATILAITKKINGGTNGLEERKELTKKYFEWLK